MKSSRSVIVATLLVLLCFQSCVVTAKQEKQEDLDEVEATEPIVDSSFIANTTAEQLSPGIGSGTFTVVRSGSCTPIKAIISTPVEDDSCMRVNVETLLANMAVTARFIDENDSTETEMELGIGAVRVLGATPGHPDIDMSYVCPPDNYNGFSRAYGSYCVASNDTQLWATSSSFETQRLYAIRVILANTYPEVSSLQADEPPFGTAVFTFDGDGLDLTNVRPGNDLVLCEMVDPGENTTCPELPENSGLNTRLQYTAEGYFGSNLLPENQVVPGVWIQDDEQQLLAGITSPSGDGGLQQFYFNRSGFFLHAYDSPIKDTPETCQWLLFCNYTCEVYNYDARFYDDLGTWRITWKLGQDQFDEQYSVESPALVRAYMGNAIDAVGVFPAVMYTNVNQTAYLGLDKIGSSDVEEQPGYAFYWYTKYNLTVPNVEDFHPPDVCSGHEDFAYGWMNDMSYTGGNATTEAVTSGGFFRSFSWTAMTLAFMAPKFLFGFLGVV